MDLISQYRTIEDFDLEEKRVLVRVDFNVPLENGKVMGDERIKRALPTIEYIIENNGKAVLMSHLGRPGGQVVEELRMDPVARRLEEILEREVHKMDDCIGPEVNSDIQNLEPGNVALLENTRFHAGEKENDEEFARELSQAGEIFINDAFGTAHRKHASTYGVTNHLPSGAGYLIMEEIEGLAPAVEVPDHPFIGIIGGKKASSKIGALWDMMERVDSFLIGGALAFTFLNAKGYLVGDSVVEEDMVEEVRDFLKKANQNSSCEVLLPKDARVAQEFSEEGEVKTVKAERIPPGWMGLDIGPVTIGEFTNEIQEASTIVWAGPLGAFELTPFKEGTKKVAEAVAEADGYRIIGGGETGTAITEFGFADRMDHVSTGGGACLSYLRGKDLPVLQALKKDSTEK